MASVERPAVRFDLLGPVRAVSDGSPLRLGPTQQRAVLAVLARAPGRVLPREYLIDGIWGEQPPEYVVNLIQKHMSGLRRVFAAVPGGRDLVKWTGTGYVLDVDEEAVDLSRAERLIASGRDRAAHDDLRAALADFDVALGLWRGTPFDGLNVPLLDTERERIDELQLSAIEARLQVLSQLGRHPEAVAELTSLVGRYPLRESVWEALMLELFRSGRQADALATYQRLRTILHDELGIDPSARMRELHRAVLTSDPALTHAPAVGVAADAGHADVLRADAGPTRPAPAQLPPRMRHMVGRESQLAVLDDALTGSRVGAPHAPHVAGVTGPAGVGKTAFALAWAHSARARFPDGQLYINLRGFDPSGELVDPLDAVRYFVDAFGIPSDGMPNTAEGLVALYRSLLAERKMLIVLDNARDVDQVRLLLPGSSSCVVAVTSRNLLSGLMVDYDAELIALDLFREDDSRALLARRLGEARLAAAPQAVGEIIQRCGGLPLTLAIVAGRAVAHPEFPLPDIAAELRTTGSQLDPFEAEDGSVDVRSVFSWSYDKLSESAARVFRLLGLSPSPETSVPAAASLAALPARQVRPVLNELARLYLLIERAPGRYVMHDLVRAHALELATAFDAEEQRTAAVRRLLQHYLHTVDKAAEQLVGARSEPITMPVRPADVEPMSFANHEAALDWLRAEFGAIHASWVRARELGDRAYVWQLATRFSAYLEYRADWALMEQMLSLASAAARDGQAVVVQAQLSRVLGQTLIRLERYPDARARLSDSFDCYREVGDLAGMAHVERLLAWTYERECRAADMIEHAAHGVEIARELGDDAAIGRALNGLGWFYALDGKLADARDCCTSALTLLRASADRFGQAETLDSLGLIHFRMGEVKAGEGYYLESAEMFSSFGDEFNAADTLANLGDAMAGAGMLDEATAVWTSALAAMRRLGSVHAQAVQDRISAAERVGQS